MEGPLRIKLGVWDEVWMTTILVIISRSYEVIQGHQGSNTYGRSRKYQFGVWVEVWITKRFRTLITNIVSLWKPRKPGGWRGSRTAYFLY